MTASDTEQLRIRIARIERLDSVLSAITDKLTVFLEDQKQTGRQARGERETGTCSFLSLNEIRLATSYLADLEMSADASHLDAAASEIVMAVTDVMLCGQAKDKPRDFQDGLTELFGQYPDLNLDDAANEELLRVHRVAVVGHACGLNDFLQRLQKDLRREAADLLVALAARSGAAAVQDVFRDYEAGLERVSEAVQHVGADDGTNRSTERSGAENGDQPLTRLLSVFTSGLADDRIQQASTLLQDDKLTTNEKLEKIDRLIRFPATTSAEQLGQLFGVTKQAVLKTDWWTHHRKGEKANETGRRHSAHKERAIRWERPTPADEDE